MPRLHRANTLACGRLRWGNCLDTVSVHCDTRCEQVIVCLRYLFMMLVSLSITGLASLFLLLLRFLSCQKTYPCKPLWSPSSLAIEGRRATTRVPTPHPSLSRPYGRGAFFPKTLYLRAPDHSPHLTRLAVSGTSIR